MENHSLIDKIKHRNSERELKEIYQAYRNEFLLWAVRNHSCTMEEAKDVFQQSIIIFYENIMSGKISHLTSQLKTYLFGIGKNKLLELSREKSRIKGQYNDVVYLNQEIFFEEMNEAYEEQLQFVECCMVKLGNPCRNLLELYYYKKKSMVTIAEIMGYKNSDTVKNLKYKCLQRLKHLFKAQPNN